MSKATNDQLAKLHATIAKVLNEQIADKVAFTDEESGEEKEIYTATPATISAAIKFLNDNNITCDPADDENLSELAEKLAKKQKDTRRKLRVVGEE